MRSGENNTGSEGESIGALLCWEYLSVMREVIQDGEKGKAETDFYLEENLS